jgi:hypothetical protein
MFKIVQVAPELVNPYAIGHLINHPPPDVPANVIHKNDNFTFICI